MKTATFDLEADGLLDTVTRVWCVVIKDHDTGITSSFGPNEIEQAIVALSGYDILIGHNCIGYDFPVLRKLYGWEYDGRKIDTLIRSRTQRPNRLLPPTCKDRSIGPHSVEAWGYRLGMFKQAHEEWDRYSDAMLQRCIQDVHIQVAIYDALCKEGEGEGWEEAHKLNERLFHYLQRQEEYGWLVDQVHLDWCLSTLDRRIDRISRAIAPRLPLITEPVETKKEGEYGYVKKPFLKSGQVTDRVAEWLCGDVKNLAGPFSRVSFRPVDLDSNTETKQFLLDLGWEPLEWNKNNAGEHTSPKLSKNDDFNGIQGSLGRLVAKRIQCRQRRGVLEGWRDAIRPDGRISAQVNGVATTGRLKHKGIVNVPNHDAFFGKWMRKLFIAKPGWVLVGTDSKGNQMRQLAARMNDEEFTRAVLYGNSKDGTDLHSLNQKRAGLKTRHSAKGFFYGGILFGAGNRKGAKLIGGTAEEFASLKENYFREMPLFRQMLDQMIEDWRATANKWWDKRRRCWQYENGYIRGLDGRPILVEFEKDILVYYLQSDEAIQMAAAYCVLHKWLERAGYKWKKDYGFVIWMHDEWQIECREEISEHVAELSNRAIAWAGEYYGIRCPHEGESKVGRNWAETH